MKTEIEKRIAAIREKRKERDELLDRLLRYQKFNSICGIAPHEISKIKLSESNIPRLVGAIRLATEQLKWDTAQKLREELSEARGPLDWSSLTSEKYGKYDSYVTTRDGKEHIFRGVNIKAILDGEE
tara:strand:+ start:333 stop:713 length:381 start_codon:yes stop_codon:yes gene_type:complete